MAGHHSRRRGRECCLWVTVTGEVSGRRVDDHLVDGFVPLAEDGQRMAQALRGVGCRVEQVTFNRREAMADWLAAVDKLTNRFGSDEQ